MIIFSKSLLLIWVKDLLLLVCVVWIFVIRLIYFLEWDFLFVSLCRTLSLVLASDNVW